MVEKFSSSAVFKDEDDVKLGFECKMKGSDILVVHLSHDITLVLDDYLFLIVDYKFLVNYFHGVKSTVVFFSHQVHSRKSSKNIKAIRRYPTPMHFKSVKS